MGKHVTQAEAKRATALVERRRDVVRSLGFLAVLGNGVACTALSLFLTGAGHGWNSPLVVSWISLVACPGVVAMSNMRGRSARIVAVCAIAIAVCADIMIWRSEYADADGFEHVWSVGRPFVIGWMASWFSWQIAAALLALRRDAREKARAIAGAFSVVSVLVDVYTLYLATLLFWPRSW